jgi:hypothetical protein
MYTFKMPPPVTFVDSISGATGDVISLRRLAHLIWFADNKWSEPRTNIARMIVVMAALEATTGEDVKLEDQDWQLLTDIIKNPSAGAAKLVPIQIMQCLPLENAVLNATKMAA